VQASTYREKRNQKSQQSRGDFRNTAFTAQKKRRTINSTQKKGNIIHKRGEGKFPKKIASKTLPGERGTQ